MEIPKVVIKKIKLLTEKNKYTEALMWLAEHMVECGVSLDNHVIVLDSIIKIDNYLGNEGYGTTYDLEMLRRDIASDIFEILGFEFSNSKDVRYYLN